MSGLRRGLVHLVDQVGLGRPVRRAARALSAPRIPVVGPRIVAILPHDAGAHTQGLAYVAGSLYESTGLVGRSTLRRLDPDSGRILAQVDVPHVWAEGVAATAGGLVQLTLDAGVAMRYRLPDLARAGAFRYDGEGWGLAAADRGFVMSDGSDRLRFRDAGFATRREVRVRLAGRPLTGLNDVECVVDAVFACVLWRSDIYEVDASTGAVRRIVDALDLVRRSGRAEPAHHLNGIAHAPDRGTFFVTGKHWPALFEIALPA